MRWCSVLLSCACALAAVFIATLHRDSDNSIIIMDILRKQASLRSVKGKPLGEMGLTAVIVGATGATGKFLVQELLLCDEKMVAKVITVGRRPVDGTMLKEEMIDEAASSGRLVQHTIDYEQQLLDSSKGDGRGSSFLDHYKGADVVFCVLGTTRGKAGSADKFYRVDHDYVKATAILAAQAGVPHFSLLTSQGATRNMKFYSKWIHPTFYPKTKGDAEVSVLQAGFPRTSIFRPGLLKRETPLGKRSERFGERVFSKIVPSLHVRDLAQSMIIDAILGGGSETGTIVEGNRNVRNVAAQVPQSRGESFN